MDQNRARVQHLRVKNQPLQVGLGQFPLILGHQHQAQAVRSLDHNTRQQRKSFLQYLDEVAQPKGTIFNAGSTIVPHRREGGVDRHLTHPADRHHHQHMHRLKRPVVDKDMGE